MEQLNHDRGVHSPIPTACGAAARRRSGVCHSPVILFFRCSLLVLLLILSVCCFVATRPHARRRVHMLLCCDDGGAIGREVPREDVGRHKLYDCWYYKPRMQRNTSARESTPATHPCSSRHHTRRAWRIAAARTHAPRAHASVSRTPRTPPPRRRPRARTWLARSTSNACPKDSVARQRHHGSGRPICARAVPRDPHARRIAAPATPPNTRQTTKCREYRAAPPPPAPRAPGPRATRARPAPRRATGTRCRSGRTRPPHALRPHARAAWSQSRHSSRRGVYGYACPHRAPPRPRTRRVHEGDRGQPEALQLREHPHERRVRGRDHQPRERANARRVHGYIPPRQAAERALAQQPRERPVVQDPQRQWPTAALLARDDHHLAHARAVQYARHLRNARGGVHDRKRPRRARARAAAACVDLEPLPARAPQSLFGIRICPHTGVHIAMRGVPQAAQRERAGRGAQAVEVHEHGRKVREGEGGDERAIACAQGAHARAVSTPQHTPRATPSTRPGGASQRRRA